jgi:hypothetical protein
MLHPLYYARQVGLCHGADWSQGQRAQSSREQPVGRQLPDTDNIIPKNVVRAGLTWMRAFAEPGEDRRVCFGPQDDRGRAHGQVVPIFQKDIALLKAARLIGRIMTRQKLQMQQVWRLALDAQDLICGASDGSDIGVNHTRGRDRQPGQEDPVSGAAFYQVF